MTDYEKCLNRAFFYLKYGAQSEYVMRRYLEKKNFFKEDIDQSIIRLKELGYIDDYNLAVNTIESLTKQGKGIFSIRNKLFSKGISQEIQIEAISNTNVLKFQEKNAIIVVKKMIVGKKLEIGLISKVVRRLKYLGYQDNIVYDIERKLNSRLRDDI